MNVAAAQIQPRLASPEENRVILSRYCKQAAGHDVQVLVFPELCVTGYNISSKTELLRLAEPVPDGPTTQLWLEAAAAYNMAIVGGLAELGEDGKVYNSAAVVTPNGFLGCYRKLHLFDREKKLFEPGNQAPRVYRTPNVTLGVLVCFDWAFPEVSRILMLEGCELLCHPANLVLPFAQQVMIARSIENRFFTITANRLGKEKDLTFHGHSQITNCRGEILAKGSSNRPQLIIAKIDPSDARDKHLTPSNHIIKDRRVTFYKRLIEK